jgi:ABC transport system ATP-binding/permease protein
LYKLIIEDDEGHTTVVPLVKEEITIGRKEGNTIRLTERNVSRHHARLTRSNGSVFIEDLDSYNGVRVNGDKIAARTTVREGDLVEIGDYHLALQKVAVEAATPPQMGSTSPPAISPAQARAASKTTQSDGATAVLKLPVEGKKDADSGRVRDIPQKDAGRLVVMTTELAGSEFPLVKTEMVVGRDEGCDVIIAHRSISSRHAKIVFDGGIYRIIDLDSANGVLVNGEEYARVDLRRGDMIELGHVSIRYAAPGEIVDVKAQGQAVSGPAVTTAERAMVDAALVEKRGAGSGKGKLIGIGAVVIVACLAAGLGYHFLHSPKDNGKTVEPKGDNNTKGPVKVKTDQAAELFNDGMQKYAKKDFIGAIAAFNATIEENPEYPGAGQMLEKTKAAKNDSELVAEAKAAIEAKPPDWDKAWELFEQIGSDSLFAKEVAELKPEIKKKVISFHLNKARIFLKANLPDKARKHVDTVRIIDEQNVIAAQLDRQIKRRSEDKRKGSDHVAVKSREPTIKKSTSKRKKKEVSELIHKGKLLVNKKKAREAIVFFRQALAVEPKNCDALLSMGIAYAKQSRSDMALKFYEKFVKACPRRKEVPAVREIIKQFREYKNQGGY